MKELFDVAIKMQQVDGLSPSKYFLSLINSNTDFESIKTLLDDYYSKIDNPKEKECDYVSYNIVKFILTDRSFNFSLDYLRNLHKSLFLDIYDHAGIFRRVNIEKKESIISYDTVTYANYSRIVELLTYDFNAQRNKDIKLLSKEDIINLLGKFISNVWSVHPFMEGNTRTISLFIIMYLKSMNIDFNINCFANIIYFRAALVRSNYSNMQTNEYLNLFLDNLLFKANHVLETKDLFIYAK